MWCRGAKLAQVLLALALHAMGASAFLSPATQLVGRLPTVQFQKSGPNVPPTGAPAAEEGLVLRKRVVTRLDPNLYIPEGVHLHSWLGFLGGSVGVLGTLLTYEKGRFKMKQRILCPYCEGSGVITCGACCGCGRTVPAGTAAEEINDAAASQCNTCGGLGVVACVNCKGEGVTVPVVLQRKEMKDVVDEFDLALEEMGIASLAANYANQEARQRLERITATAEAQLKEAQAKKEEAAAKASTE